MITKQFEVMNELGIHARPSCLITKTAICFKSKITFERMIINKDKLEVNISANAKDVLAIMMLKLSYETKFKVITDGVDEEQAMCAIESIINDKFEKSYEKE